ncbi:MAG: hypothetical protein RIB43_13825 [Rhodospirillaceae bacterium]
MNTCEKIAVLGILTFGLTACADKSWRDKAPEIEATLPWSYSETPWYEKHIAQRIENNTLTFDEGQKILRFYSDIDPAKDFKYDLPMEVFIKDASGGDRQAQAILGVQHLIGYNAPCDACTSLKWFSEAALQGHPVAYLYISMHYMEEYAIKQNQTYSCYAASLFNTHYGFDEIEIDNLPSDPTQLSNSSISAPNTLRENFCDIYLDSKFPADTEENFKAALLKNTRLQSCPVNSCTMMDSD